jgi:hypothetical protein
MLLRLVLLSFFQDFSEVFPGCPSGFFFGSLFHCLRDPLDVDLSSIYSRRTDS